MGSVRLSLFVPLCACVCLFVFCVCTRVGDRVSCVCSVGRTGSVVTFCPCLFFLHHSHNVYSQWRGAVQDVFLMVCLRFNTIVTFL